MLHIYIVSSVIDTLEQKYMTTSSSKYELNLAKSLSEHAYVEILSTKIPFGVSYKTDNLILTGIGIQGKTRFELNKYKKIQSFFDKHSKRKDATVLFWGYDLRLLIVLLWVKLRFSVCCIPFIYDHHSVAIKNMPKKKRWIIDTFFCVGIFLLHFFDRYIFFQENAAKELHITKPYLVSKPGVVPKIGAESRREDNAPFCVAFCGTLNELNGVDVLLQTIPLLDSEKVVVHIYGSGPMEKRVKDTAEMHTAVVFHGVVSDSELMKVYQESDLLINLRRTDDYAMNFSFPSKLFEYIGSGCPVLTTKMLEASELNEYLYVVDVLSPESVFKNIKNIMSNRTEAKEKAKKAKEYVEEKYCFESLGKEIFKFLQDAFANEKSVGDERH